MDGGDVYTLSRRRGRSVYGRPRVFKMGQSVPVAIEGTEMGRMAVADILPRIEATSENGA